MFIVENQKKKKKYTEKKTMQILVNEEKIRNEEVITKISKMFPEDENFVWNKKKKVM